MCVNLIVPAVLAGMLIAPSHSSQVDPEHSGDPQGIRCGARRPLADLIAEVEQGVVVIEVDGTVGSGHGSGFFVDRRHVITNLHVVIHAESMSVRLSNGVRYAVSGVLDVDLANDLALLEVDVAPDSTHRVLRLDPDAPRKGENVFVVGAPQGMDFTVTRGIVSAVRSLPGLTSNQVIQIDAAISPGSSGGPVLNDGGSVIGIASFQNGAGESLNFAQGAWNAGKLRPRDGAIGMGTWVRSNAPKLLAKARASVREGLGAEAVLLLSALVGSDPGHPDAWFDLGRAFDQVGDSSNAIRAFERHAELSGPSLSAARAMTAAARTHIRLGDGAAADAAYRRALDHEPAYRPALAGLAALHASSQVRSLVRVIGRR